VIKQFLQRLIGEIKHSSTSASVSGDRIPGDLRDLAAFSRRATRTEAEVGPPGPKKNSLSTDDLDPNTGVCYPDYLARRRQREAERARAGEGQVAGLIKHDIRPD
jgi:hypothetical protein